MQSEHIGFCPDTSSFAITNKRSQVNCQFNFFTFILNYKLNDLISGPPSVLFYCIHFRFLLLASPKLRKREIERQKNAFCDNNFKKLTQNVMSLFWPIFFQTPA